LKSTLPAAFLSVKPCGRLAVVDLWPANDGSGNQLWRLQLPQGSAPAATDLVGRPINLQSVGRRQGCASFAATSADCSNLTSSVTLVWAASAPATQWVFEPGGSGGSTLLMRSQARLAERFKPLYFSWAKKQHPCHAQL
jgi:hypothetical protein